MVPRQAFDHMHYTQIQREEGLRDLSTWMAASRQKVKTQGGGGARAGVDSGWGLLPRRRKRGPVERAQPNFEAGGRGRGAGARAFLSELENARHL